MLKMLHIHTLPIIRGSGINTFLTMRGMKRDGYDEALAVSPLGDRDFTVTQPGGLESRSEEHRKTHAIRQEMEL